MAELPTDLQRLVAEARLAHDPDDAAQARVRAALSATLSAGVAASATVTTIKTGGAATGTGTGTVSASKTAILFKLAAAKKALLTGAASVVVLGGGVWAVSQGRPSEPSPRAASKSEAVALERSGDAPPNETTETTIAERPAARPEPAQSSLVTEMAAPTVPAQSVVTHAPEHVPARARPATGARAHAARVRQRRAKSVAPTSAVDTGSAVGSTREATTRPQTETGAAVNAPPAVMGLGVELNLIRRATAAVSAGHYAAALDAVSEHASRFPTGSLVEERLGLRAVSLCKLRRPGAQAAARSFAEQHPDSPLLARVRAACDELP